jgi:hypothetical protein
MDWLLVPLLSVGLSAGAGETATESSYLYEPAYCLDHVFRGKPRPYLPQPGDLMLYTEEKTFWTVTHALALAFKPHGSGVVIARPDGSLGILEAGPNDSLVVGILDLLPHLQEYADQGPVWIRKRRTPLTPSLRPVGSVVRHPESRANPGHS